MKRSLLLPVIFFLFSANVYSQYVGIGTATPGSGLTVNGSMAAGYLAITANTYTLTANDYYIVWNQVTVPGLGVGIFTLPPAAALNKGRIYKIKNNSATYGLAINNTGSVLIDNSSSFTLPPGSSAEIIANGNTAASTTCWEIVSLTPSAVFSNASGQSAGVLGGAGGTCTPAVVNGSFTGGVAVTNQSVTISVSVTVPGNYTIATNTQDGINFSSSGFFTSTGIQNVILYAHGTALAEGNYNYSFSYGNSTCSFSTYIGDGIRYQMNSAGCTSCAAYDAAAVNAWVEISLSEYNTIKNNLTGAAAYVSDNATMAISSTAFTGGYTVALNATTQTTVPASQYPIAMEIRTGPTAPPTMAGIKLKASTLQASGYVTIGNATPNVAGTILSGTFYHFVLKRPTFSTSASGDSYMAYYTPITYQVGDVAPSAGSEYFGVGDISNPSSTFGGTSQYQVVSTGIRQW